MNSPLSMFNHLSVVLWWSPPMISSTASVERSLQLMSSCLRLVDDSNSLRAQQLPQFSGMQRQPAIRVTCQLSVMSLVGQFLSGKCYNCQTNQVPSDEHAVRVPQDSDCNIWTCQVLCSQMIHNRYWSQDIQLESKELLHLLKCLEETTPF